MVLFAITHRWSALQSRSTHPLGRWVWHGEGSLGWLLSLLVDLAIVFVVWLPHPSPFSCSCWEQCVPCSTCWFNFKWLFTQGSGWQGGRSTKHSRQHGNGNILLPFPLSLSWHKLLMLGACSSKLPLAQHNAPFISVQSKVVCSQYFMKLHGFDLQGCMYASVFLWVYFSGGSGWPITMDCSKPQAKVGACLDTNHKLQLMEVLEASEVLCRTRCCTWLLLRKFCCSVVGTSKIQWIRPKWK